MESEALKRNGAIVVFLLAAIAMMINVSSNTVNAAAGKEQIKQTKILGFSVVGAVSFWVMFIALAYLTKKEN